jgi:pSer/pThr/pTyr-binding forkhead associated (FHA) protein
LEISKNRNRLGHHPLDGESWILGRGPNVDIHLDGDAVSRCHAELRCCPFGRWWIHDRGSTNGTYVNGRRIESHILVPGDEIAIGNFALALVHASAADDSHSGVSISPLSLVESTATPDEVMTLLAPGPHDESAGHNQLDAVLGIGRRLMGLGDKETRRSALCECAVERLGAIDAHVVRVAESGIRLLASHLGSGRATAPLSKEVLRGMFKQAGPVIGTSARAPESAVDERAPRPRMVLACPLMQRADGVDGLYVELPPDASMQRWFTVAALLAGAYEHAELLWTMRDQVRRAAFVEHELETARVLQRRLIPYNARFENLDVVTGYQPCRWVGGDYVDAVALPEGNILLVIADVCGKGLQGALVAATLHTLIHGADEEHEPLSRRIRRMNRHLCRHLPDHSFVTLVAISIDPVSGKLECVNAGHPPALVASHNGAVRELQAARNVALGFMDTEFEVQHDELAADELLILYTDGFTELLDRQHEPLGADRFADGVRRIVTQRQGDRMEALESEFWRMLAAHRDAELATDDAAFLIASRPGTLAAERPARTAPPSEHAPMWRRSVSPAVWDAPIVPAALAAAGRSGAA